MRAVALVVGAVLAANGPGTGPARRDAAPQRDRPADARGATPTPQARSWTERQLRVPIVRQATAYVPAGPPAAVFLFLSGDGGWNEGVVDMARRIAAKAVVIGISYPALRAAAGKGAKCWYAAGDLEIISRNAQKQLGLAQYTPPVLIGYSSGATLVYGALASAPPTTFAGGVSLGFCPDLPVDRPICPARDWRPTADARKHEAWLPHVDALPRPWLVLNGADDRVCDTTAMRRFVAGMSNAQIEPIEGTGHGFGRPARWGATFDRAIEAMLAGARPAAPAPRPAAAGNRDLETALDRLELPLTYSWAEQPAAFVVFFSGDGGWAAIDDAIADVLAAHRISVIGISSLKYFWHEKTVAQVASDLAAILSRLEGTGRPVFVGGYSFGASVAPLALQAAGRGAAGLVLLSPDTSASFEIDPLDWIRTAAEDPATRVAPAIRALNLPTLCIAGTDEDSGACLELPDRWPIDVQRLPGSHHFNGDYAGVGEAVTRFIESTLQPRQRTRGR
jgi:type IV secretory pathway VirJ component